MLDLNWEKPSEGLSIFLAGKLSHIDCEKRKIFGQIAYFINGNMFTGIHQSSLFLRFSSETKTELMSKHRNLAHFEPKQGVIMKEYITIPIDLLEDNLFQELLTKSINYVSSLPKKKKKRKG